MLSVKRVYQGGQGEDGIRILVDRLWPRGLRPVQAGINEWAKDLSPSDGLRKWFAHKPERWLEFRQRYIEELAVSHKVELLERIARMAVEGNITLVYAARDTEHNNARVVEELVTSIMKNSSQA